METGLSKGQHLLAYETEKSREMADLNSKRVLSRTAFISLSTLPLGGISQVLGAPVAVSLTLSGSAESVPLIGTCHPVSSCRGQKP